MLQAVQLTLNRYMTTTPNLAAALRKINIDTTALKKNDKVDSTENSEVDTVEISSTYKKADTSVLRPDIEELVNYVREQAERRKPPRVTETPEDIERTKVANKAYAEELERLGREKALAAKARQIDAKMKSGQLPNAEEMNFLREHFPESYMDAKRMAAEREQFRNQLRNCDTKEEITRLVLIKKKLLQQEAETIIRASKHTKAPVVILYIMAMMDKEVEECESNSHVKKADRVEVKGRNGKAGNAEIGIAAIDRETEEDDKRNSYVKKANREGVKERNGKAGNAEIGSADDVEIADTSVKTSPDPAKKASGDDKKDASGKGSELNGKLMI